MSDSDLGEQIDIDMEEYDNYYLGEGPIDSPYHYIWCPVRGEPRATTKCKRFCASQGWSHKKARNVRKKCPAWEQFQNLKEDS